MPRCIVRVLMLSVAWMVTLGQTPQPQSSPAAPRAKANNDPAYQKLRNIQIGEDTVPVQNFVLKRDAGVFTFKDGMFYFLQPVNKKITGAVFIGEATFALTPPTAVEQRNLAILTKGEPYEEQFTAAVFRFTDGTDEEIRKAIGKDSAAGKGNPEGHLDEVQKQLRRKLRSNLAARLLGDVLSSQPGGKFTAFIKGKKYSDKTVFDVDPQGAEGVAPEEIELLTWDENHAGIWAAFHFSRQYADGTANNNEQNAPFVIQEQKLDTSIARNASLRGKAQTTLTITQDGVRVLPFDLFQTLRVESVTGAEGQELSFIQEEKDEDAAFAVILPREYKKGETLTITTVYGGKEAILSTGGGNYLPVARDNWYPGQSFGHYSMYDMTFRLPKGITMVATGTPLGSSNEGGEIVTHWKSEVPLAVAGFNLGSFKREEGKPNKQAYVLETYANPEPPDMVKQIQNLDSGFGPSNVTATMGTMSTLGLMKKAMGEAQLSIDLYSTYFGEVPYKRLAMTQQTATNFGQAWPGLVYLPITYFFDTTVRHQLGIDDARGYFKVVGPHEIAHQWWGHLVGFNCYRDQWMSEGFAEMSASLFLQHFYREHGLDDFHKFWADERYLMTVKNAQGRRAIDVGPLTLGTRLSSAKSGFDIYRRLIYPKGAYVLHMIRFLLWNEKSPNPDAQFMALMHDFTKTYANRAASTEDFKAMVEKYMTPDMDLMGNHKMDWFFNEYVYGTDYPHYLFEHSFSNDANGDVVLNIKLSQSEVSKNFAMSIPLYVELNNGRVIRLGSARLLGNNSMQTSIPLKGVKEKPKRALIAYYDDILGNIENK